MSIHHAGLEVRPACAEAEVAFWALIGFVEVAPPPGIGTRSRWVERDGVQIHLLLVPEPVIPGTGHVAVVAVDYERVIAALRAAGHDAAPRTEYWGAPRTQVRSPAGHLVEITAAAPPPAHSR